MNNKPNNNIAMMRYFFFVFLLSFNACTTAQSSKGKVKVASKGISAPYNLPAESGNFKDDMLTMVNTIRASGCKCGSKNMPPVAPVKWNDRLESAAINHARDMFKNKFFDHIGSDGSEIDNRVERVGYKWMEVGENIAWGYKNTTDTMIGWLKSTSHCRQLMSPKVTEMGVARNGDYWVQDFGKQRTW
jgi:uncharacterized protein YkwD